MVGIRQNNRQLVTRRLSLLVFSLRKHFSHNLQHPEAFVSNEEFYAVQTASLQTQHMSRNVAGGSGEIAIIVVAAAVALTSFIALIAWPVSVS